MSFSSLLRQFQRPTVLALKISLDVCQQPGKFTAPVLLEVSKRWKDDGRRTMIRSAPIKDWGTAGEKNLDVDLINYNDDKESAFPDGDTANTLFDGVKYSEIPICHIKTTKNNTIMRVDDYQGKYIAYRSCGLEGFKNCRKGTNIAAQTTAITIGNMAKEKGVNAVRVLIKGLGPGRMSSVKGLQMAGIKIISVSDNTGISWNPPRPRKARRL